VIDISSSTNVQCPSGDVFDFVRNIENAQMWLGGWLESRPTSETEGIGFTWIDVIEVFGRRVETEFELTEFEPGRKLAFRSIQGSFPISGDYSFQPNGEGTSVIFALQGEPGGFFKLAKLLLGRMLQRQWDTNLANLKDVLESG
jgi:uncharacterized membrane protein